MKKVFAILLVLVFIAGFAFATEGSINVGAQRITVTSEVDPIYPQFSFKGSMTSGVSATTTENVSVGKVVTTDNDSHDGTKLDSGLSIAETNIVAYFVIYQSGAQKKSDASSSNYARYTGLVTFDVEVGAMTEKAPKNSNAAATVSGSVTAGAAATAASGNKITNNVKTQYTSYTANYYGKVVNNQDIATFTVTWPQDDTVPNGTYEADVTLTISAS